MRRQGQYADSGISQMMAAQMQHMPAQRVQHNSGMNHFVGRGDSLPADEEKQYTSSKAEEQWNWDREEPKGSNLMSSHMYKEGQGSDIARSSFHSQRLDPNLGLEKQVNKDSRSQDDMELGYEDNALPQTFEGLEQKFIQDIMKLIKEQQDAEDIENTRHRERLSAINTQYHEKFLAMRARQAANREDFLRKESQARHQQYQQTNMSSYQNSAGSSDAHGFSAGATAFVDMHRDAYAGAAGNFDSYGERSGFGRGARGRGFEARGPYPGGRAYNQGRNYF